MENNQSTYRIRTKLGDTEPINIPISLIQEYNSFEILSLKLNMDDTYRSYTSTDGIVIGRVSTANNGLGIPNVRVSIFIPKGEYSQTDEEEVLYPFSSPTDKDGDKVRYNLLPSESDVSCYQVIGTFPTKRKILDNETVCEVFEKYYKYTTVTNEAGDFMLTNIPVGKHKIHIDADLSDIGPFLSQKPYDMIENLGFEKNRFDSTRQFKTSKDLDSLAQVISQTKSVYVYPYWGDMTEYESDMKITRTDLSLNYEFKTNAIFIGSVITDKQSNALRHNCTATESAGKMADMVTGPGRIEMIRKTVDDKIEQYRIKGDMLINDNGVWCYMIPMNLDYVRTDEFGNIIPTDDPNKGVPTRARVRFRVTLNQMESDEDANKRCSYLVPNNPKSYDPKFLKGNDADYSFGSETWDESFVDLFWNKVYTVKNYVPRLQKTSKPTNRKHTGIKMVNHCGDNNPFPYNDISIKLTFLYRLICVIVKIFIGLVRFLNTMISILGALPCWLANLKILWVRPFGFVMTFVPTCVALSAEFCDDGINRNVTYPGCIGCIWVESRKSCNEEQYEASKRGEQQAVCINNSNQLETCVENQLAQQNEVTSFNFSNDWINGCLYMPLWYRHIRPKKSFLFGLFTRSARDQWCASENTFSDLKMMTFCSNKNRGSASSKNYKGESVNYKLMNGDTGCGDDCHEYRHYIGLSNGVIINKTNSYGQKVWYYKAAEVTATKNGYPEEYTNYNGTSMVSKLLYATDIVLLGSMNDCDLNGIPKFFNYLKASSFNLPTDILFSDTEISYSFDNSGNLVTQDAHQTSVASGCDWGNENEYGYDDGGLFYGIGCNSSEVRPSSCVNLRRICELGVGLDEMQYIENLNVSINSENDNLDLNNNEYQLRPDGYVSYDDIIDFNYRSMFATMNGNKLRTKINTDTGVREYDFRYLYIDNFDGSLAVDMTQRQSGEGNANYRNNYKLESTSLDYLTFRMGDNPYYYDGDGYGDSALPKYENSFYFYFGLKEGKTAIDLFNEQYNGVCATKTEEEESIDYDKQSNSWCCFDSDNDYKHSTYDGFLTLNLENITLPCSIILNSNDNSSVTYTVVKVDGKDTTVTDEKICFYSDSAENIEKSIQGCIRYKFIYENSSADVTQNECQMLNNGTYNMYITDGEGNQHSFIINLNGKYLEFDDVETPFKQPNNILTKYYKTIGGKYASSSYNSVAKSPENNTINVSVGSDGVPVVERTDNEMKNVVKDGVIQGNGLKLNGTICLHGVYCNNIKLNSYVIEVEPYDKDNDENYSDEDFWKSATEKSKTWYCPKMCCIDGNMKPSATTTNKYGKTYVNGSDIGLYFKVVSAAPKDSEGQTIEDRRDNYIVIKVPKGGVNYRVRVTQLCKDGEGWFKSNNYVEKKLFVSEPTPYKLYINDVDYDIIKKFKTGYVLKTDGGLQNGEELKPFKDFGTSTENSNFGSIKGWLHISDMFNEYYDWEADIDKYGKNITESEKNQLTEEQIKNRTEFISKMKSAFWVQCEDSEKSISYSISTDDTPYDILTIYNEEKVSDADDEYNETKSDAGNNDRNGWQCKAESAVNISGVKIPTITSYDSKNFGISNDSVRQSQTATYAKDKSACFAQDNVAEKSESGSVSIKPPYLVACVNKEGITIPSNLKKGESFDAVENEYVGTVYNFGDVGGNQQKIRSGEYEFFGFHLIDKIFAPNIVCWSYINNVPYYVPWVEYDVESTDDSGENVGNKLGYSIKMEGILSGAINNGISNSVDENGFVDDFEETNIFSKEVAIKTFDSDTDDSIPTRRCVVFDKTNGSTDLKYRNYRFTTEVKDKNGNAIGNQFRYVLNSKGSLSFRDNGGECEAKTDLYGSMKVRVLSTTLNQVFSKSSIFDYLFDRGTGEGSDTSLTLRVSCSNGDTEKPITYYIFRASQSETKGSGFDDKVSWYPLNSVKCTVNDGNLNYWVDCKCDGNDSSQWVWDGSSTKAVHLFNKNTVETIFKDKNNDDGASLVDNDVKSGVEYTNENGETEVRETSGYGQTGVFTKLKHLPYFIVAVTENNCRAISPVYDFHTVYYIAGLLDLDGTKVLRTGLLYVLAAKGSDHTKADNDENYGYSSRFSGYSKYPRNYYLSQYDFTISYTFSNGNTIVTNDGVTYEKESNRFVGSREALNDDSSIGMSYAEPKEGSTTEYILYTNTGGSVSVSERITEAITGTPITPNMDYYYEVKEDGGETVRYQLVKFSSTGEMDEEILTDTEPSDATKLESGVSYYVTYTEEEEDSESGEKTTVTYYVGIKYSTISEETVDYNPMIPYFMRYTDKSLTNDEYNTLKPLFLTKSTLQGKDKFYVTDVTGLKHKCVLHDVCNSTSKWNAYMQVPS